MINKKEVINLKFPFPNIQSGLARKRHMYICKEDKGKYSFIKSQTFKPSILSHVNNYIIEDSNINRNPFSKKTLIDLDKEFHIRKTINISRDALCRRRPDICDELFKDITHQINCPSHQNLDDESIIQLNPDYLQKVLF
ncbi:hypothetical protein [Lactococcus lactis]|uniref:hypothetical protein n=1 Tax=Lactococcus lactis TaxID=1358 RepID=UPI00223A9F43|nr:hypothetical protein [Lactococcus lactis]MCT0448111.1 hypothetical protein [Lactococcus lactis subsp. lactis]